MFGIVDEAQELAERAAALAGGDSSRLADMPEAQLTEQVAALVEARDFLEAALADRLAVWDAQSCWAMDGAASGAQWLGRRCGADPRVTAHEIRTARKLARTPRVRDAVVSGKLSRAKARILVRYLTSHTPTTDEERRVEQAFLDAEADFVELARKLSVRQCERLMRRWYLECEPEDAERRWNEQWAKRHLHHSKGFEGMGILDGVLDPESDAIVDSALNHAYEGLWRDDAKAAREAGDTALSRTAAQRRVDALVEVAQGYLASVSLPDERGNRRPALPTFLGVVEIDPHTGAAGSATIGDDDRVIGRETLERLLCDSRLTRLLTKPGSVPLDMGHSVELATPHQRRALRLRDGGCAFPGCERPPRWCNAHHCHHRQHGGPTDLDNLVLLCRYHHRLMHEGGWECWIDDADGRPRFRAPDGRIFEANPPDPRPPRRSENRPSRTEPCITNRDTIRGRG
jgi:hypothetical protein